MPFVPDNQPQQTGFVPDSPSPTAQPQGNGQIPGQSPNALGTWASAAVRPLARGANMILNFVPDVATDIANLIPESIAGPKMQRPSEAWDNVIDKYTTRPTDKAGKVAEGVSSALVAGGRGAADLAMATPGLVRRGAQAAGRQFSRITTRAAEQAHTAGYELPPSHIGGDVSRTVQTMSGGPKVEKVMSAHNEAVTDRLAATQIGLHPDHELTEEAFEHLRQEAYQPYEEVRAFGTVQTDQQFMRDIAAAGGRFANRPGSFAGTRFPEITAEKAPYQVTEFTASEALDEMRMLRRLSSQNLRQYNPQANALGYTQREISNALENQINRAAQRVGSPGLVDRLRAARVALSQIAAVEDSVGAGGHVRAEDLRRMLDAGTPLTGNLRTIAETARNFPKAVQQTSKTGETGTFSAVDYLLGGTGIVEGHPGIAALSLARPISRWALGTGPVQRSMIRGMTPAQAGSGLGDLPGSLARGFGMEAYEEDGSDPTLQ